MRISVRKIFFLLVLIPILVYGAPTLRITSDAPNGKIEVGETFHITIEAKDFPGGHLEVGSLPPGVKKVYETTQQTSKTAIINGKTEQETTTQLILTCKGVTVGKYTYGPVSKDGKRSNTISYEVIAASGKKTQQSGNTAKQTSSPGGSLYDPNSGPLFIGKGNEEMYLRATVNKATAYEQEAVEYVVKLYTTYGDIKFLGAAAAPKFDGFVIEESKDVSTSFKFEDVGGKTFMTAIIARYIIFPQRAGKLTIKGNTYTVSTDARQYYHDPYFQTITVKQPIQLDVTPNDITMDVKELPTPVPSNFIGGVGKFRISSNMPSTSLTTNTAAVLDYTIEGTGNIKYVKLPSLTEYIPKSFEIYSPEVKVDAEVKSGTVSGSSKFEYSIIPREAGNFEIPALELVYFDPNDGEYKTLKTQSYNVSVALGKSSSKSQQAMTFNSGLLPVGKIERKIGEPYVNSLLYWLWFVVPVLIFAVSLASYRHYLRQRTDMVVFRSKNANKMAMKRLAKALQCLKNHQEEEFYDEMLAALWGYLADKLKIPTAELNRNNVSDEFKKHGVKEATFQPIINLIDECEYAKYSPVSRDANMQQIYSQAIDSLSNVENEYEEETRTKPDETEDEQNADNYINTTSTTDDIPKQDKSQALINDDNSHEKN